MRGMSSSALILLLAVATIAVVSSCGGSHRYPQELSAVDSICKDSAEVAMSRLQTLSEKYDQPSADAYDRNYYLLLKVKAANNAYQPLADSTIFHVLDFFRGTAEKDKLCQSYYYLGKYYIKKNDAPQGLENFQKALDLTDENTPLYFRSCIYNQMGKLFVYQEMYDEGLKMYRQSFVCDSMQKDTINMAYSLKDIATVYSYKKQYHKQLSTMKDAFRLAQKVDSKLLNNTINQSLTFAYYNVDDMQNAKCFLFKTLNDVETVIKSSAYAIAMDIYEKEKKPDSVFFYSALLMTDGDIHAKHEAAKNLSRFYVDNNDTHRALFYLKEGMTLSDSLNKINAVNSVAKMHFAYNYSNREKENIQLKAEAKENKMMMGIIVLGALLLGMLYAFMNERNKKKYLKLKHLNEQLDKLREEATRENKAKIEEKTNELIALKTEIRHLNKQQKEEKLRYEAEIKEIQSGIEKAISISENSSKPSGCDIVELYTMIQKRIGEEKNLTPVDWETIDSVVNKEHPYFKTKLYKMHEMKDFEYKICLLIKMGFQNSEISVILHRSYSAITQQRTNLYTKFFKSKGKAKDFDNFIRSL